MGRLRPVYAFRPIADACRAHSAPAAFFRREQPPDPEQNRDRQGAAYDQKRARLPLPNCQWARERRPENKKIARCEPTAIGANACTAATYDTGSADITKPKSQPEPILCAPVSAGRRLLTRENTDWKLPRFHRGLS